MTTTEAEATSTTTDVAEAETPATAAPDPAPAALERERSERRAKAVALLEGADPPADGGDPPSSDEPSDAPPVAAAPDSSDPEESVEGKKEEASKAKSPEEQRDIELAKYVRLKGEARQAKQKAQQERASIAAERAALQAERAGLEDRVRASILEQLQADPHAFATTHRLNAKEILSALTTATLREGTPAAEMEKLRRELQETKRVAEQAEQQRQAQLVRQAEQEFLATVNPEQHTALSDYIDVYGQQRLVAEAHGVAKELRDAGVANITHAMLVAELEKRARPLFEGIRSRLGGGSPSSAKGPHSAQDTEPSKSAKPDGAGPRTLSNRNFSDSATTRSLTKEERRAKAEEILGRLPLPHS